MKSLKVLSFNIHKGFNTLNLKYTLHQLKELLAATDADVVFLQEVIGHHSQHGKRIQNWPQVSQFEFLADTLWPHFAYGKNAVYQEGHHGNAILSRFPIIFSENIDISAHRFESRGLLHVEIDMGKPYTNIHLMNLHLGLFKNGRDHQVSKLIERIERSVPHDAPLLAAGDFNDWQEDISHTLNHSLELNEAFLKSNGKHAKTFPSWMPLLGLDRIYFRHLELCKAQVLKNSNWTQISDHAPIQAEFNLTCPSGD